MEESVLGGGCFWGLEGGISGLRGVESATSGYSGGHVSNPS
ncbi:MAG: peptide-methionine (S)-S-oxide reductase, partial [Candidatus Thermoplasmatota archaeon]|nr:peptide-methionine (S)-S-oxide reductase [Candidatus Thermoplasmatota archaeon]